MYKCMESEEMVSCRFEIKIYICHILNEHTNWGNWDLGGSSTNHSVGCSIPGYSSLHVKVSFLPPPIRSVSVCASVKQSALLHLKKLFVWKCVWVNEPSSKRSSECSNRLEKCFFLDPFHYRLTTIFNAVMVFLVSYVYCMSCLLPDALYNYNFCMVLLFHVKLNFGEPWAYLVLFSLFCVLWGWTEEYLTSII